MASVVVVVVFAVRLIFFLLLHAPAPNGDSILFASVAHYQCTTGRFETPIFPLDPSGGIRYVWHGLVHPMVLSWLAPGCGVQGLYLALIFWMLLSAGLVWLVVRPLKGAWWALAVAVVVFALQSRQGFRPETTAVVLVILADCFRFHLRNAIWTTLVGILAWLHPTAFVLYLAYALLTTNLPELRRLLLGWKKWLPLALAAQVLLLAVYPFPIKDLLHGLSLQGQNFGARSDGSVWTYYLRSDFFPLFGVAFGATWVMASWRRPALLLLFPLIWYYGLRVPPANYNLITLWGCLLWWLVTNPGTELQERWALRVAFGSMVLAMLGLSQSILRDTHSWLKYGVTPTAAQQAVEALQKQGLQICGVPAYFTLLFPAPRFEADYNPQFKGCRTGALDQQRDLVSPNLIKNRTDATLCSPWASKGQGLPGVSSLLNSDSGYSFWVCPHQR